MSKVRMFLPTNRSGFTLIEAVLVIAILVIVIAVVIVAIDPEKQLGEAENAQRQDDIEAILNAVNQYSLDNYGSLPADNIPSGNVCVSDGMEICIGGAECGGVVLDELTDDSMYLTELPADPVEATDMSTGYYIFQNQDGRIGVCAPGAYNDADIDVM